MYVCVCLNHSKSTKKKTRRAKCILGWIYCVHECPMREWRTQNESMDGHTCRIAIDQDVKIPRTRFVAPEWLILLEPILHAIHVYMQYTIHMQKGLWNLWIRNEAKESSLIDTEKITILLIRRKLRWRKTSCTTDTRNQNEPYYTSRIQMFFAIHWWVLNAPPNDSGWGGFVSEKSQRKFSPTARGLQSEREIKHQLRQMKRKTLGWWTF